MNEQKKILFYEDGFFEKSISEYVIRKSTRNKCQLDWGESFYTDIGAW